MNVRLSILRRTEADGEWGEGVGVAGEGLKEDKLAG
jgi:hypothetical protein